MDERRDGLYDQLITSLVQEEIVDFAYVSKGEIKNEQLQTYIVQLLTDSANTALASKESDAEKIDLANKILEVI
ncbi:MAG: hypothetical protein EBT07_14295, partial [Actinobacteria bacterium]|nr:hypothetical protein [Actinomycetota bacterium]